MSIKNSWRIIIRAALFLAIFALTFSALTYVLTPKRAEAKRYTDFAELPNGYADVLFVGSSSMYAGVSPLVIWEQTGISSQSRATTMQGPQVAYAVTEEALKHQSPKMLLLGTLFLFEPYNLDKYESNMHVALDPWPFSFAKIKAAQSISAGTKRVDALGYVVPLLRYHDRWNDLKSEDFKPPKDILDTHGHFLTFTQKPMQPFYGNAVPANETAPPYDPVSLDYYEKIIALCKSKGIQAVIIAMPRFQWTYGMHLGTKAFADKHGLDFIDCNTPEAISSMQFDFQRDFYIRNHTNAYGAVKVSSYIGNYLVEHYDLQDRRGDPRIAKSWNDDLQAFKDRVNAMLAKEAKASSK